MTVDLAWVGSQRLTLALLLRAVASFRNQVYGYMTKLVERRASAELASEALGSPLDAAVEAAAYGYAAPLSAPGAATTLSGAAGGRALREEQRPARRRRRSSAGGSAAGGDAAAGRAAAPVVVACSKAPPAAWFAVDDTLSRTRFFAIQVRL